MSDERDDEQAPYSRSLLDTKTAEVIAAIIAVGCLGAAAFIVLRAIFRHLGG